MLQQTQVQDGSLSPESCTWRVGVFNVLNNQSNSCWIWSCYWSLVWGVSGCCLTSSKWTESVLVADGSYRTCWSMWVSLSSCFLKVTVADVVLMWMLKFRSESRTRTRPLYLHVIRRRSGSNYWHCSLSITDPHSCPIRFWPGPGFIRGLESLLGTTQNFMN